MIRVEPRPVRARTTLALALGCRRAACVQAPTSARAGDFEIAGLPCMARRPKGMPFADWITDTLVRRRGVVAALPRAVWSPAQAEFDATVNRIVALDPSLACGKAWWWLLALKASQYTEETAYSQDDLSGVYHTDGLEATENRWLPKAEDYDTSVQSADFDNITLAGFSVCVRFMPPLVGAALGTFDQLPALQQRTLLELEAAAIGTGPAILATMLVHSGDRYADKEGQPARADAKVAEERPTSAPGHVVACVTVTQTHSFRLGDLLGSYNDVLGDPLRRPSLPAINGSVYELTAAIARKVRQMAASRILKLNVVPDAIVFCPRLVENPDDQGQLEAAGYGYAGMHTVKGVPFMWDFDPLCTKRVGAQNADYDADCAYVVMMLVMLSSVRAQYGETVARIMINKVVGRDPSGATLPPDELPEDFAAIDIMAAGRASRVKASLFCAVIRTALPVFAKEREATLGASYADVAQDFADVVRSEVLRYWDSGEDPGFDRERPIFQQLVQYLSRSAHADTALFAPPAAPAEAARERERAQLVEKRLDAVRQARAERLFG